MQQAARQANFGRLGVPRARGNADFIQEQAGFPEACMMIKLTP
jgi:hypothetical protein